jgi:hypothetical protein
MDVTCVPRFRMDRLPHSSLIYPKAEAQSSETSVRTAPPITILIQFVINHIESNPDIAPLFVAAICGDK